MSRLQVQPHVLTRPQNQARTPTRVMGRLETMERLGFGQVPAAPLFKLWEDMGVPLERLTTARQLYRYKITGYIPFNTADKMMVESGLGGFGWLKFPEIYWRVSLRHASNCSSVPRLHGTGKMYEAGCKCVPCSQVWSSGRGRGSRRAA